MKVTDKLKNDNFFEVDKLKNADLFELYLEKHGKRAFDAILEDYESLFSEKPPLDMRNSCDIATKYSFEEEVDIYLTAIKDKKPYKIKEGDFIDCGKW